MLIYHVTYEDRKDITEEQDHNDVGKAMEKKYGFSWDTHNLYIVNDHFQDWVSVYNLDDFATITNGKLMLKKKGTLQPHMKR